MNKEIQSYFSDPKELSKRQSSMMDQVLTFQSRQRERYVKALRSALKSAALRQQQLQEQIKQLSETNSCATCLQIPELERTSLQETNYRERRVHAGEYELERGAKANGTDEVFLTISAIP